MAGIGIVNNPRSRRNRRHPETAGKLRQLVAGAGEVLDASTLDELAHALARFRERGIDTLGVNGGDGTAHIVLSAALDAWRGSPFPQILLLRGGAMNTVARGQGISGTPEGILSRLLERRRAGKRTRTVTRDLLRIEAPGLTTRHGFIFGTGAAVSFLDVYYGTGRPSPAMALGLLARAVGSALSRGRFASRLTEREWLRITVDGEEWPEDRFVGVIAATTPEIGFGFAPFTRCEEQPGFFHAVGVVGSVRQIVASLPGVYRGRAWRRRVAVDTVARELSIDAGRPVRFTVDGDLYESPSQVTVSTGPAVELLTP
ncbi:MAG TPA: diacylglycerol kinase family protein [Anaeromyxobacteraceae bacterium]|nr:diacylglycerol kinase family protein [Anaeromyxobacteraceae bacterium]